MNNQEAEQDAEILSGTKVMFDRARLGAETPLWQRDGAEQIADCRVFRVRRDHCINPRDESTHDFYCLEMPDWINIIPLTPAREVVMIEQYRHGINRVTLEIPGGMVDAGEDAADAARRELFEETGYAAKGVQFLGTTHPNPALQDNSIHTYLAEDVQYKSAPLFDGTEHTAVRLVPLAQIPELIADNTITHSLVVVGFYWLVLWKENLTR